jgi:hypothetical protein
VLDKHALVVALEVFQVDPQYVPFLADAASHRYGVSLVGSMISTD